MDLGREEKRGCWGGRLAERAGRWILQDGLDRQRYRRGKGVVVKTGDAPQASVGISWRDAGEGLICLRPSHHPTSEKQKKKSREEREEETPKETSRDGVEKFRGHRHS